jgi:acetylornithine deacetylase
MEAGKLFGLGSNDAGGSVVCLALTFLNYCGKKDLPHNLIYTATAEEEISGPNGLELILPDLGNITCAIVGEPTNMNIAVAEKGLLVIDCVARGVAGHAARDEGENSIYKAIKDIAWFSTFEFPNVSKHLGKVKMSVTIIQGGAQHNVIPGTCCYTVDIRVTDVYTHEEVLSIIKENISSEIKVRSTRLRSSSIPESHPLVLAGIKTGRKTYGSPTSSDQALLHIPSIKMGPGDSARSHSADEFIYIKEIKEGISIYTKLIDNLFSDHKPTNS